MDEDAVIDAVLTASRVLVAIAARSLADAGEEVTLTQYRALVVLASRGPQSIAALAEAAGCHSADGLAALRSPRTQGPGPAPHRPPRPPSGAHRPDARPAAS